MSEKAAVIKGHGHVTPNADGSRTRCGGPTICKVCKAELAALKQPSEGGDEAALRTAVAQAVEYLDVSGMESICSGSVMHQRLKAALSSAPNHSEQALQMVHAWNLAADALPACGKSVLAYYLNSHGKGRRIRAEYVKSWTVQTDDLSDPDTECVDYSEQEDAYYISQGWYELIDNWDEYGRIAVHEGVITHWQELPAAPSAGSQEQGE